METRLLASCIGLLALVACGGSAGDQHIAEQIATGSIEMIEPMDFAIAPCSGPPPDTFCAVIAAGGKRVLIGAPSGIGDGRLPGDRVLPDAILLPSLHPSDIEGLTELRYQTWSSGRATPLVVSGPVGTEEFVEGLNAAYALPDAVAFLDISGDRRDFSAMPFSPGDVRPGKVSFDTGDFIISAQDAGNGRLAFVAVYNGLSLLLLPCDGNLERITGVSEATRIVACRESSEKDASFTPWPADEIIFLNRTIKN